MVIRTLFPLPADDIAISHICTSLCRHMRATNASVTLSVPQVKWGLLEDFMRPLLPAISSCIPFRFLKHYSLRALEEKFLESVEPGDIAYLWCGNSTGLIEGLEKKSAYVVQEKFNCHTAVARAILDAEYDRLGIKPAHTIDDACIAHEVKMLDYADAVFSPSPCVTKSLTDQGVAAGKVLQSSYGWSPERFPRHGHKPQGARRKDGEPFTVLFAGTACVRKGTHLLLEAWKKARIQGRLRIVGAMEPAIATTCAALLGRSDVEVCGFTSNLRDLFESADIFAFPSLEEGSPLVSYEAAAHGLAMIVSPMGAGDVIRDDVEGVVREARDVDQWVDALRELAHSPDLRHRLGQAAAARAMDYTWDQVGPRRVRLLRELANAGIPTVAHQPPLAECLL